MEDNTKKCPYCAETIKAEAIVCRYCGRDLPLAVSQPPPIDSETIDEKPPQKKNSNKTIFILVAIFFFCCGLPYFFLEDDAKDEEDNQSIAVNEDLTSTPKSTNTPESRTEIDELPNEFSHLDINDISYDGEMVIISGSTDLPDSSLLDVTFDLTGYAPDDLYLGISTQVEVSEGQFIAKLSPPNIPEYEEGPYEVEVRFRPGGGFIEPIQNDTVVEMVGESGESLVGDKVVQLSIGDNIMVTSEIVDLPLKIQIPSYPQIDASNYPIDSPERALAEYLLAWQTQNWDKMAEFTQKTWQEDINPSEELMYMYDFKTLLGAEIGEPEILTEDEWVNEVLTEGEWVSIPVILYYSINKIEVEKRLISPMIIRETAPFETGPLGDWGVNPISTLAEEDID